MANPRKHPAGFSDTYDQSPPIREQHARPSSEGDCAMCVPIRSEDLVLLFTQAENWPEFVNILKFPRLPPESKVERFFWSDRRRSLVAVVSSPAFPATPTGQELPFLPSQEIGYTNIGRVGPGLYGEPRTFYNLKASIGDLKKVVADLVAGNPGPQPLVQITQRLCEAIGEAYEAPSPPQEKIE